MPDDAFDRVLATLNDAYRSDPVAVLKLLQARVPCNAALATHEHVVVKSNDTVSALGLLNGLMAAAFGARVAMQQDDRTGEVIGFTRYIDPATH